MGGRSPLSRGRRRLGLPGSPSMFSGGDAAASGRERGSLTEPTCVLPEEAEPLSPELVLVCPELRDIALARERVAAQVARPLAVARQVRPLPSPTRRSPVAPTMALAVVLVIGAYAAGYVSGTYNTSRDAADPTPSAVVLAGPRPGPEATSDPASPSSFERSRAATTMVAPAPAAPAASLASAPPARSSGVDSRVVLSANGLYVTSLASSACPGAPKLPWLLVSRGRFAWEGELDGFLIRVAGRLTADDHVNGTATYHGRGCDRTITYRGRATRAAR